MQQITRVSVNMPIVVMGIRTPSISAGAHIPLALDCAPCTANDSGHMAQLPITLAQPKVVESSTTLPIATYDVVAIGKVNGDSIMADVLLYTHMFQKMYLT